MTTFKDLLSADNHIFFNENEFATEFIISGDNVPAVFDKEQLQKYNLKAEGEGLTKGELLFYAPVSAFTNKPFVGMRLRLDNNPYEILNSDENLGVYTIILVGYRS